MCFGVDPPPLFRAKDVFDRMYPDANAGMIEDELHTLAVINAIARVEQPDDFRSKYYRRLEFGLWQAVADLASHTIELAQSD